MTFVRFEPNVIIIPHTHAWEFGTVYLEVSEVPALYLPHVVANHKVRAAWGEGHTVELHRPAAAPQLLPRC